MLQDFSNYDYLWSHQIYQIEDLVGLDVYFAFPTQGIKCKQIRKVSYHVNNRKWFVDAGSAEPVENLGVNYFLSEEEAVRYQFEKLESYTKQQQERILKKRFLEWENDINKLNKLLEKYPTEESRKLPAKDCSTCKQSALEYLEPHTCDECTSLSSKEEYSMWSPRKELYEQRF